MHLQPGLDDLCRGAKVTRAQIEQAIAGEALDPAIVARLSGFLAAD